MSGSGISRGNRGDSRSRKDTSWVLELSDAESVSFRTSSSLVDALSVPTVESWPGRIEEEVPVIELLSPPSESMKAKAGGYRRGTSFDSCNGSVSRSRRKGADPFADKVAPQVDPKVIQVAPGIQAVLRGTEETWEAIQNDLYIPCQCFVCTATLFVIQDAAYVLCPRCLSVVPLEGDFINRTVSGIGMGFTVDDLMRWQLELRNDEVR